MLAELGAEVIKVEDPVRGDPMRQLPPLLNGRSLFSLLLDRGKKSVALDIKKPESRPVLDGLIAQSDVVIESFRPKTARHFGVSAEQIRARHPRVIHCAITGYGQTGPYADRPGHDLNYVSASGFLATDRPALSRVEGPNPAELPRMFIADIGGGATSSVIGILAALFARERTGEGASLDISMHEAAMYWMMLPAARELVDGGHDADGGLPTFGDHACYNVYRTKDDRLLALGALEEKFWRGFCGVIGRPDLADRQMSAPADQAALLDEVRGVFASRTRAEWLEQFGAHEVCLTPVNTAAEALADPHVAARGAVVTAPGLRAIRSPFVSSAPTLCPAPALGAYTDDVLGDLAQRHNG